MIRWLNPVIFVAAALYVRHYNASHQGSQLIFPGTDALAGGDLVAAGALTWQLVLGLGGLLAIWAVVQTLRSRGEAEDAEDPQ